MTVGRIKILVMSTNGIMNDGITTWMSQTFGAMDSSDFDLVTVAFEGCDRSIVESIERAGFKVVTIPNRKKNPQAYAVSYRKLLDKEHFSIVHICCNSALAAFELYEAKKRVVKMRIAHSHNTMCSHRVANFIMNPAFQVCLTDRYACGTAAGKWLFGSRSFTIIPNGKELSAYAYSQDNRESVRKELGVTAEEIVIGHVGLFNEQKNHRKLLDAYAALRSRSPRYRLALVGDGALVEETRQHAISLGISDNVSFLGRRADVPRLLNAMDCMVFPSLFEGFPNVVLEWQLNGLPVVMSDKITDECAITPLVSQVTLEASPAEWADAVERTMAGRDRAADSAAARLAAKAAGYDIHENAAMLRRLYLEGVERCG